MNYKAEVIAKFQAGTSVPSDQRKGLVEALKKVDFKPEVTINLAGCFSGETGPTIIEYLNSHLPENTTRLDLSDNGLEGLKAGEMFEFLRNIPKSVKDIAINRGCYIPREFLTPMFTGEHTKMFGFHRHSPFFTTMTACSPETCYRLCADLKENLIQILELNPSFAERFETLTEDRSAKILRGFASEELTRLCRGTLAEESEPGLDGDDTPLLLKEGSRRRR
ncbi:MAG: hypothetical protein NTW94_05680 [Legionellales bacterium]|nr:hypothetical protein [Legionellales bacterium]